MSKRPFLLDQPTGYFPFRSCRADRRFSYGVYVPSTYTRERAAGFRVLVAVHGSERAPEAARELFVDLAEELQYVVLAPLFPVAITDDEETHNYIFLKYRDIRYDHIVLSMIDEVVERFGLRSPKFLMAGFSGGGQFVHRFMYLHAARLGAVSIGAPGVINTLDEGADWFVGVRDVAALFGQEVDHAHLKGLPVQVVIGSDDLGDDIIIDAGSPLYMAGVNDSGATRVERAQTLHRLLLHAGVASRLDVVQGAAHASQQVHLAVASFFRSVGH